jgi:inhibitor of KinA
MTFSPLGDSAVVVALSATMDEDALARVRAVAAAIEHRRPPGVTEVMTAFGGVAVYYDPTRIGTYTDLCATLSERIAGADKTIVSQPARLIEIPVCYGGEFGPDIREVASHAGLSEERVVALHAGSDYRVQAVGFAPGFAYLSGLPEKIRMPRRATPRTGVPAGTVGIGGTQTGVYPLATPGGWNLIGRTPLRLFDATREEPALVHAGDRVKFRAIGAEEFAAWR